MFGTKILPLKPTLFRFRNRLKLVFKGDTSFWEEKQGYTTPENEIEKTLKNIFEQITKKILPYIDEIYDISSYIKASEKYYESVKNEFYTINNQYDYFFFMLIKNYEKALEIIDKNDKKNIEITQRQYEYANKKNNQALMKDALNRQKNELKITKFFRDIIISGNYKEITEKFEELRNRAIENFKIHYGIMVDVK